MAKKSSAKKQVALFYLEGYSEDVFYSRVLTKYMPGIPKTIKNVKGLYNIHKVVLGKSIEFVRKHPDSYIRIYCCIDRESRDKAPELDIAELKKDISDIPELKAKVLSVDTIIATQMLESWFFIDIEGIYKYLRTPKKNRNPAKYKPIEKFTWKDLHKLFADYNKTYYKGEKSDDFVDHIDIDKIYITSAELNAGITKAIKNSKSFKFEL